MNRKLFIILLLFVVSRVIFINPQAVFFDSPEYLNRLSNPNYLTAILSGHLPLHLGYIFLFWPLYQIGVFLHFNPAYLIVLGQIFFSTVTIYCFYRTVAILTNEKTGAIASIIGSLLPLYWITNTSIMVESTYVNFFLISLFFMALYARNKNNSKFNFLLGCITFGLSLLTHPLVILWLPLLLFVVYFLKRKQIIRALFGVSITFFFAILINSIFVSITLRVPFLTGIYKYLFGEDLNIMPNISSFLSLLRFIRNAFVPILQNNTLILLLLAILSLIKIYKINKKLFIIGLLWVFPSLFVNQWFNPLLSGRHGIIAEFGIAFLVAIFLENRKKSLSVVLSYVLIVFLPAFTLLKQPIPYLMEQKFVRGLQKGLLIESHFARPQLEGYYSGKIIFVNEPGWDKESFKKTIDSYLNSEMPIFITSQALSDPYGVYSGPFLLPLSLSYANKFELEDVMSSYQIKKYAVIDEDAGLMMYEIISKEKSKYPIIPRLNYNRHRIDYYDPITQLWFFIERAKIIQIQSIIKG